MLEFEQQRYVHKNKYYNMNNRLNNLIKFTSWNIYPKSILNMLLKPEI